MNLKILNEVEHMLQTSPQAVRNQSKLKQLVRGIFDVELGSTSFTSVYDLTEEIDRLVLHFDHARVSTV